MVRSIPNLRASEPFHFVRLGRDGEVGVEDDQFELAAISPGEVEDE
jgi:hypothetical protein